ADSDEFLDETLRLSRDPSAWPILIHCHACMDRSPAWMGIYRFVVQGRSLREIFREIEGHRGYRPKASVTLLYNRVLPPRAPARGGRERGSGPTRRPPNPPHEAAGFGGMFSGRDMPVREDEAEGEQPLDDRIDALRHREPAGVEGDLGVERALVGVVDAGEA